MPRRPILSLLFAAGFLACSREPGGASLQPERSAPAKVADQAAEAPRRLALLRPEGGRAVDGLIEQIQAAAQKNAGKVDLWVGLGRAWVRKARETSEPGYYVNADACAEIALGLDPDSAAALDLRGLVLLNDHRFSAARDLAQRALAKNRHDPMAYGTLSDAELELGGYDAAVAAAARMMELKPNLPSYSRAAYLAWLRGDGRLAKASMKQAIDASPMSRKDPEPRAWALTQAALLFWHEGDYEGADAGYQLALQGFPDYPAALVGRARILIGRGQGKEAAALLERAYADSPLPETAWLLGDARAVAGDAAGAEEAYGRAVKHGRRADPRTLAQMLSALDREPQEALRLLAEERKARGDVYTQDAYAFALYRAGRLQEARAASDEASRLGTRDARLLFHAGAIRLATGDAAGGRRLLTEALALNPKFDLHGAAEAARLLGR